MIFDFWETTNHWYSLVTRAKSKHEPIWVVSSRQVKVRRNFKNKEKGCIIDGIKDIQYYTNKEHEDIQYVPQGEGCDHQDLNLNNLNTLKEMWKKIINKCITKFYFSWKYELSKGISWKTCSFISFLLCHLLTLIPKKTSFCFLKVECVILVCCKLGFNATNYSWIGQFLLMLVLSTNSIKFYLYPPTLLMNWCKDTFIIVL